jgi:ADP-ribosyl-[dinitrogen reductase] hydrolase
MNMSERVKGALLGVAIGDALGGTVEFIDREEIRHRFGVLKDIVGGGNWKLQPGEVTDDTYMTLAVANGILEAPIDPTEAIAKNFLAWYLTKPKDIGVTCRLALQEGLRTGARTKQEWFAAARSAHFINRERSAGNGSLMRTVPVALAYFQDEQKMLEIAKDQSRLTHFDSLASDCTMFYCQIIRMILLGTELKTAIRKMIKIAPCAINLNRLVSEMKTTGYVVDTLESALICAYRTESFEDSVIMAANLGGDADTIAAVTGGLTGSFYGCWNIPERWLTKIMLKEELLSAAALFINRQE